MQHSKKLSRHPDTREEKGNRTSFDTGAQRSSDCDECRLDLICPEFMFSLGDALYEGFVKYTLDENGQVKDGGTNNWTKGIPSHMSINHIKHHLELYRLGDRRVDHLGHAAAGLMFLRHFELQCPCEMGHKLLREAHRGR